jgi:phage regulator Rha-like protein
MNLLATTNQTLTMSSREIASLLNKQHSHIKVSAQRLAEKGTIALRGSKFEHNGNTYEEYLLEKRDCLILVAQNCPEFTAAIVDRWQELEGQSKPLTQLEIIAQSALALVEHEKKLTALEVKAEEQQKAIEDLRDSYSILPQKPANAESVSYIRMRVNREYGLPARIINEVLYSFPYSPKPAGQVRNTHENANNNTYTVWNTSEVTKLFKRFVSECEHVTKTQAVHPSIDGRFKLNQ